MHAMLRRPRRARPAALLPALVLAAVAVAGAIGLRVRSALRHRVRGPGGAPTAAHVMWTCTCGQRFRSAGLGRHQVHWLADAPEDEPVLGDACPSCGRALPVTAA